jgi:tetratricopeptide (TPR) repeat protein
VARINEEPMVPRHRSVMSARGVFPVVPGMVGDRVGGPGLRGRRILRKGVELAADEAFYLRILGIALYRNEQVREAVPVLEKSLARGMGQWDAADLFFLAMCHAKLGEAQKARECQDRAVRWLQERESSISGKGREELNAFQAEAAALLRLP